jgi:hypothetical protein
VPWPYQACGLAAPGRALCAPPQRAGPGRRRAQQHATTTRHTAASAWIASVREPRGVLTALLQPHHAAHCCRRPAAPPLRLLQPSQLQPLPPLSNAPCTTCLARRCDEASIFVPITPGKRSQTRTCAKVPSSNSAADAISHCRLMACAVCDAMLHNTAFKLFVSCKTECAGNLPKNRRERVLSGRVPLLALTASRAFHLSIIQVGHVICCCFCAWTWGSARKPFDSRCGGGCRGWPPRLARGWQARIAGVACAAAMSFHQA